MASQTNDPTANAYASSWPAISAKTSTVAGIITNIFGLEELPRDCEEVACLWLLHPRLKTQECMKPIAALAIADWNKKHSQNIESGKKKGLIAVSFDQRNHGSREVDSKANQAWREGNETHAQDMFSIYRGTAIDTSLLLDHIAGYAFPGLPIKISQNIVLGISLGGHAAWHVILHDQRFDSAVIVIGCPDYQRLMSDRARLSKLGTYTTSSPPGSKFVGSKDFPLDLTESVLNYDPAGLLLGKTDNDTAARLKALLSGKRIMNQSGGADKLVPYRCAEPFLSWLKSAIELRGGHSEGRIQFYDQIYEGVGHEFTPAMLADAVTFITECVGSTGVGGRAAQSKI